MQYLHTVVLVKPALSVWSATFEPFALARLSTLVNQAVPGGSHMRIRKQHGVAHIALVVRSRPPLLALDQ